MSAVPWDIESFQKVTNSLSLQPLRLPVTVCGFPTYSESNIKVQWTGHGLEHVTNPDAD